MEHHSTNSTYAIGGDGYRKHRQVWPYAKRVPSRISAGILQSTASLREITSSFAGDKLYSAPAAWADNARVGKAGRSSKKTESQHLAEMGRAYEHLEGAGGEKNFE